MTDLELDDDTDREIAKVFDRCRGRCLGHLDALDLDPRVTHAIRAKLKDETYQAQKAIGELL